MKERYTEAVQEYINSAIERGISDQRIIVRVDGMVIGAEAGECGEIDIDGGEVNINLVLGLKRIIERHPREYNPEYHWPLFTEEERQDLLIKAVA